LGGLPPIRLVLVYPFSPPFFSLLFSATFSDEAFKFAQDIIRDKGRKSADGIARVSVVSPVKR
jgi:hypothetical protein